MHVIRLMNLFLLILSMVNPINSAPRNHHPRSVRPTRKTKNRSPFSKSLVKGIEGLGTSFFSRKKKTKKNSSPTNTNQPQSQSTMHALRDAALGVGGDVVVASISSGAMSLSRGAGAVEAVANTAGDIYSPKVNFLII